MLYPWNATFFSQFTQQSIPQALLFFWRAGYWKVQLFYALSQLSCMRRHAQ